MARGRMISQTVATDKRFNALSNEAALVFLMTVPHLDRDGLILADACILAGKVCPRRRDLDAMMQTIIDEWIAQGMVLAYDCEDGTILFFTGFAKNQAGMRYDREPKSTLPVPPGYVRSATGLELASAQPTNGKVQPSAGTLPTSVRQSADNLPSERARAEVEVEVEAESEVEEKEKAAAAAAAGGSSTPPWLRQLWEKNMSGTITPILAKLLREAVLQYPRDEIEEAMRICIERGHYDFAYMAGILKKGVWEKAPAKNGSAKDGKRRYSEVPPVERKKYSIDDYVEEASASP